MVLMLFLNLPWCSGLNSLRSISEVFPHLFEELHGMACGHHGAEEEGTVMM